VRRIAPAHSLLFYVHFGGDASIVRPALTSSTPGELLTPAGLICGASQGETRRRHRTCDEWNALYPRARQSNRSQNVSLVPTHAQLAQTLFQPGQSALRRLARVSAELLQAGHIPVNDLEKLARAHHAPSREAQ
jgi:hypothetical protein